MQFYLWAKQDGEGCDYTIGCGEKLIRLSALSVPAAVTEAESYIEENFTGERELSQALFLQAEPIKMDLDDIYGRIADRERAEKRAEEAEQDRRTYERLQAKFGAS